MDNGTTGTIQEVDAKNRTLTVLLDNGEKTLIPIRDYLDVVLGYALTTHKGQGMTVDNSFILAGGTMGDRELSYVQASRARNKTEFFTDKIMVWNPDTQGREEATLRELARQMSQSRQKDLAHDVNAPEPSVTPSKPQAEPTPTAPPFARPEEPELRLAL